MFQINHIRFTDLVTHNKCVLVVHTPFKNHQTKKQKTTTKKQSGNNIVTRPCNASCTAKCHSYGSILVPVLLNIIISFDGVHDILTQYKTENLVLGTTLSMGITFVLCFIMCVMHLFGNSVANCALLLERERRSEYSGLVTYNNTHQGR